MLAVKSRMYSKSSSEVRFISSARNGSGTSVAAASSRALAISEWPSWMPRSTWSRLTPRRTKSRSPSSASSVTPIRPGSLETSSSIDLSGRGLGAHPQRLEGLLATAERRDLGGDADCHVVPEVDGPGQRAPAEGVQGLRDQRRVTGRLVLPGAGEVEQPLAVRLDRGHHSA